MRKIAALLASLALVVAVAAAPASAQPQGGHTSCQQFGLAAAATAHDLGGLGDFVEGINTAPGAVADTVAAFQEQLCEAKA
jgi:hypothetical protein